MKGFVLMGYEKTTEKPKGDVNEREI